MKYLDLTFADPCANLACDQALLELFESERPSTGCLRLWEPSNYFVVLGHANRLTSEANSEACKENHIPIIRRVSGGGAVLQGPGCLNYSLILKSHGRRHGIGETFEYVLRRHCRLFETLCSGELQIQGVSDLTLGGRKFSGNAQYRKSSFVLVHGSFLLNFDLPMMEVFLSKPSRQPEYRMERSHLEFTTNMRVDPERVRVGLRKVWGAQELLREGLSPRIDALVRERYGNARWSEKF